MKAYKLRHKETGLFWNPSHKAGYGKKNNLTKKGKLYMRECDLPDMVGIYRRTKFYHHGKTLNMIPSEWEKVEYTIVESSTEQF